MAVLGVRLNIESPSTGGERDLHPGDAMVEEVERDGPNSSTEALCSPFRLRLTTGGSGTNSVGDHFPKT
ncbi:unnamed protein product [Linum trigynum]|uniref:Uncharacterized protein n=1 Tax=Linum trigynum TaxID=586398 RepID=A0AAV2CEU7_9ROSI